MGHRTRLNAFAPQARRALPALLDITIKAAAVLVLAAAADSPGRAQPPPAPRPQVEDPSTQTTQPTTRAAGSRLEFRIVPNRAGSSRLPLLPLFVGRTTKPYGPHAKADLAANGPLAGRRRGDEVQWFELACELPGKSATAEYKGRKYMLLCGRQPYVMLPDSRWGLKAVSVTKDARGSPAVGFELDENGARLFEALTRRNRGNALAMIVDGRIVSAPVIKAVLSAHGMIVGKFTDRQARNLAAALRAGMRPPKAGSRKPTDARKRAEAFIAAAVARRDQEAADLAEPTMAVPKQIADLRKLAGWQVLHVISVHADDSVALAVTSEVTDSRRRTGHVLLTLRWRAGAWRVMDIDLESAKAIKKQLEEFLKKHPKAREIPKAEDRPGRTGASGDGISSESAKGKTAAGAGAKTRSRPAPAKKPLRPADPPRQGWIVLSGRIVDDATGKPIKRFTIQWGFPDAKDPSKVSWGGTTTTSRGSGRFRVRRGWLEGKKFWVRVLADGYAPQPITPEPLAASVTQKDLVVRLKRGGAVRGRVLDHKGKPVAGALVILAGNQPVEVIDGLPDHFTGSTAKTDEDGRFVLRGAGGEKDTLVVSAPSLHLWRAAMPNSGTEATIELPEPAAIAIRYDIQGDQAVGQFRLQLKTWERARWKGIVSGVQKPDVRNEAQTLLRNLTPGVYDLARMKHLRVGDMGKGVFCDRRTVTLRAGRTTRVEFVRKTGAAIAGEVLELKRAGAAGAFIYVKDAKATGNPRKLDEWKLTTYDAVTCGADGRFRTARIPPGTYTVIANVYRPEPPGGVFRTGWRLPDLVGVAKVTVPKSGAPPRVRILPKPRPLGAPKRPRPAPATKPARTAADKAQPAAGPIAWGKTVKDLRLGLAFDLQDRPYRQGELVSFVLHVRNTGREAVTLLDFVPGDPKDFRGMLIGWAPTVRDGAGKKRPVAIPPMSIPVQPRLLTLPPGGRRELGTVALQLTPARGRTGPCPVVRLEPGAYRVSQTYRFRPDREATWSGELTSGELALRVAARASAASTKKP